MLFIKKGKTNWIYVAIVFLSAAVTGVYLMSYIGDSAIAMGIGR
jgi:hypothetical protein